MKIYRLYWCFVVAFCLAGCQPTPLVNTPVPPSPTEVTLATVTPLPSVTALPTPTHTATETPTALPTATEEPSVTLPPATATTTPQPTATQVINWVTYEFEQVQISLPATFQTFEIDEFPLDVADGVVSDDCQTRLDDSELAFSGILLTAIDISSANDSLSFFLLVEEQLPPATTLDTTLERLEICDQFDDIQSEIVTVNELQVGRVVVEAEALGFSMTQISYLFQIGNQMWSLIYTFWSEDAETQLPLLQQVVESFTILSE
ncbi:hypothetical protein [Candidatus Leptofilum sp.]|uniref:hypothetical protein n=1 Tax=Candidatus Leptofilum sp. TaxID=3241576 RepID=UPI003B59DD4A